MTNLWQRFAPQLRDAYTSSTGSVRFQLVTRALLAHIGPAPQRVADVGGGFGEQAIRLARLGHDVDVVDLDEMMLEVARRKIALEPPEVRMRIQLELGLGSDATQILGTGYDAVCCHSVLMYEPEPQPLIDELVNLVHVGGVLSILSVNPEASALRSGLQGRWIDTVATLASGRDADSNCLPTAQHTCAETISRFEESGARLVDWYGVGIFTDHLTTDLVVEDPSIVYEAEWLAGLVDPYRGVARCFHLVMNRVDDPVIR